MCITLNCIQDMQDTTIFRGGFSVKVGFAAQAVTKRIDAMNLDENVLDIPIAMSQNWNSFNRHKAAVVKDFFLKKAPLFTPKPQIVNTNVLSPWCKPVYFTNCTSQKMQE